MTTRRIDHIQRITQDASGDQPTDDVPTVALSLVEHLERKFGSYELGSAAQSQDDLVTLATNHAVQIGRRQVLDYLKALAQGGNS